MGRPLAIKGTPEQRRELREQRRRANRVQMICDKAATASDGRELLGVACQYALAVSKDFSEEACEELAAEIEQLGRHAEEGTLDDFLAGQDGRASRSGDVLEAFAEASRRLREAEIAAVADAAAVSAVRTSIAPCEIDVQGMPAPDGEGFLYILQFSTGAIKVGQTVDLRKRLAEHRRDASAFNVVITDFWVSSSHAEFLAHEKRLIAFCNGIARRAKSEYFHGTDLATVREFAVSLPTSQWPADAGDSPERRQAVRQSVAAGESDLQRAPVTRAREVTPSSDLREVTGSNDV